MGGENRDPENPSGFLEAATVECPFQKLDWTTDTAVWIDQWPLRKDKLKALNKLMEEQLAKGNIVETTSPWNSPVFVICKPGKDKWHLFHDLREINKVIVDMVPLQPGMPTPTMLPRDWKLAIIDIKDCFFQIPLHPDDAPWFAFSVPTLNREAPVRRFHWQVLPQGMKNSPTIWQWYVSSLLSPVCAKVGEAIIHYYMDDVLVCAPHDNLLRRALDLVVDVLTSAGFQLQEEKVQRMPPWKYLGLQIAERTIVPQNLAINSDTRNLADLHSLCGTLNWVRPWLGLPTEDLAPLFILLKGEKELSSSRSLTPEARKALEKVQDTLVERQEHRYEPNLPFEFIVLGNLPHLFGLIYQWDQDSRDPLLIIEWVFLSHQRSKSITRPQELMAQLIRKVRARLWEMAGCGFTCIWVPVSLSRDKASPDKLTKEMFNQLLQENETLQIALGSYCGQVSVHAPAHKLFNSKFNVIPKEIGSKKPLKAVTIFTDTSRASHKSVMTWKDPQTQQWETDIKYVEGSPQVAELAAFVRAFERFPEPFNLVTDSAYVAGVVARAENAILKEVLNPQLFELLSKLIYAVSHRKQPFFVMHVRSHTELSGPVAEGNESADSLAAPVEMTQLPDVFQQAKLSHQMFYQNVPGLVRQFHLRRDQAKATVATCPQCQSAAMPPLGSGVNPRGLGSC
ncbi:PREDICTED: endogenous retrovirus group K member 11 Pol protein-like [Pseudopodoces humilis]|uniref:endogenous retrovirus group K member 11 Pol protein-like n=1 Tax=Pseudopodoces humilis TaxID=181119 RepID=UPI0006B7B3F0|nr:PREDICTED: endogenous retrovirus group K member 11 Pol protein-like [Pseudopodoces humilis]